MATRKKGKELSKKQIKLIERCMSDKLFDQDLYLRTQVLGTHLVRILDKNEKKLYCSIDGEYFMYNPENKKALQYNCTDKNQIDSKDILEKLWKEV